MPGPGADLLGGPEPILLPAEPAAAVAAALGAGQEPATVAARHPEASLAWAVLAEAALERAQPAPGASSGAAGESTAESTRVGTAGGAAAGTAEDMAPAIAAYAFARTGYHRGLDALRRAGWKGRGPVPWSHEPNRGVLRSVRALGSAAALIGETSEAERCRQLLHDSDPSLG